MAIIAALPMVIAFWQFRQTNWIPARRTSSAANANDFSWRNRTASWNGASQIITEYPWLGTGWGRPESLYDYYYIPARLGEGAAIQMNVYFTVGDKLGFPALCCFAIFLRLTVVKSRRSPRITAEPAPLDLDVTSLQIWKPIFLSAATVLLVGLWFDGELFTLTFPMVFWPLCEMGYHRPRSRKPRNAFNGRFLSYKRTNRGLSRISPFDN